ncbi:MAG: hypothetical protein BM564_02580 [Bacteroidetes bacterium MedPE-SWsnd-G2]|nr:MAG: hypothetical protein BM564_02580 [Bacteroidetes bacterium MedPE-SWsnd-G2]
MHYLLLTLTFLTTSLASAQLYVKNSDYMYVKGDVLYVEDNIVLNDAESKIYLRSEGQLIQGTGTTGNSGLGELSVHQEGTVNQFAYNFWCSPVGGNLVDNTNNNGFKVNQLDDSTGDITSVDAAFTSGANGSSSPLTISSTWLYTYTTSSSYSGWNYKGANGNIATGLGFTMKGTNGSSENQLYDFRGKPNNGTISNTVSDGGFTLIGNPYPSALDAYEFLYDAENVANITGELYYWEQAAGASSHYLAEYIGGYATYTIAMDETSSFTPATFTTFMGDGTATNFPGTASPSGKTAKRYIPIGQGFLVEGVVNNGTVKVKNAHRKFYKESGSDSEFFRLSGETSNNASRTNSNSEEPELTEEGMVAVSDAYKRFRLNVDFNETYTRQLLMNFHDSATDGFDYGLEGKSPGVLSSDAYWTLEGTPYAIQAFSFDTELAIPVVLTLNQQQSVNFRMFDIQNFDSSQPIYIHDIENDVYVDLRTQEYFLNLEAGDYSSRFEIVFQSPETLSVPSLTDSDIIVVQNNKLDELLIANPTNLDITTVIVFDINGKQVMTNTDLENQNEYSFNTQHLTSGVYIVSVNTSSNQQLNRKVIVNN